MSIQLLVKHIRKCKKDFLSIFINENNEQILPFLWHQCPKVNLLPNPDQGGGKERKKEKKRKRKKEKRKKEKKKKEKKEKK